VGCLNCLLPTCENSKNIGKAQGNGPPVYTPSDLANQGNPDSTSAPIALEGVRQLRMAVSGNTNCKSCIDDCLAMTPMLGLTMH
jgi:hypothetical protein